MRIAAEQMQSVNIQLDVGQTTESITVAEQIAPLIDTQTAMIGGTIPPRRSRTCRPSPAILSS